MLDSLSRSISYFVFFLFFTFVLVNSVLVPHDTLFVFYLVGNISALIHIGILYKKRSLLQSNYIIYSDIIFAGLSLILTFVVLLMIITNNQTLIYEYVIYIIPLIISHNLFNLTNGKVVKLDHMLEVKSKFNQWTNEKFLYRIIPFGEGSDARVVPAKQVNNLRYKLYNDPSLNDVKFSEALFLFRVDNFNSNTLDLEAPNAQSYSKKLGLPLTQKSNSIDILKWNTLVYLFIQHFDTYWRGSLPLNLIQSLKNKPLLNGKVQSFTDLENVSKRYNHSYIIKHRWNLTDLREVSRMILDSIASKSNKIENKRLIQQLVYLLNRNKFSSLFIDIFLSRLIINSKFELDNDSEFLNYFWNGLNTSFEDISGIYVDAFDDNTDSEAYYNETYLKNRIVYIDNIITRCVKNPSENFIEAHTKLVRLIDNESKRSQLIDEYLDESIIFMMNEFKRTEYLEQLVINRKYTSSDMVSARNGILAGCTILLSIFLQKEVMK